MQADASGIQTPALKHAHTDGHTQDIRCQQPVSLSPYVLKCTCASVCMCACECACVAMWSETDSEEQLTVITDGYAFAYM